MTTTGVGIRPAQPLGWTITDANGNSATIPAMTLTDITGVPVTLGGGGGGGGGAVTIADGAATNLGSLADATWTSGNGTITSLLKAIATKLLGTIGVTGTFWQATQPVSIAAMPSTPVTGTFWPATQPVSGTVSGPLPAAPITGQQTLTTSAAALPSNALQNGIVITALQANTGTVYVGGSGVSAATGYPLSAGQSMSFAVANASGVSIIGTNATDKVAFAGN